MPLAAPLVNYPPTFQHTFLPTNYNSPISMEEIKTAILNQIEDLFAGKKLSFDPLLRRYMDSEDCGISFETFAQLPQIQKITRDFNLINEMLKETPYLSFNETNKRIVPKYISRSCLIFREMSSNTTYQEILGLFANQKPRPIYIEAMSQQGWYVFFEKKEDASKSYMNMQKNVQKFKNTDMMVRIKVKDAPVPPTSLFFLDESSSGHGSGKDSDLNSSNNSGEKSQNEPLLTSESLKVMNYPETSYDIHYSTLNPIPQKNIKPVDQCNISLPHCEEKFNQLNINQPKQISQSNIAQSDQISRIESEHNSNKYKDENNIKSMHTIPPITEESHIKILPLNLNHLNDKKRDTSKFVASSHMSLHLPQNRAQQPLRNSSRFKNPISTHPYNNSSYAVPSINNGSSILNFDQVGMQNVTFPSATQHSISPNNPYQYNMLYSNNFNNLIVNPSGIYDSTGFDSMGNKLNAYYATTHSLTPHQPSFNNTFPLNQQHLLAMLATGQQQNQVIPQGMGASNNSPVTPLLLHPGTPSLSAIPSWMPSSFNNNTNIPTHHKPSYPIVQHNVNNLVYPGNIGAHYPPSNYQHMLAVAALSPNNNTNGVVANNMNNPLNQSSTMTSNSNLNLQGVNANQASQNNSLLYNVNNATNNYVGMSPSNQVSLNQQAIIYNAQNGQTSLNPNTLNQYLIDNGTIPNVPYNMSAMYHPNNMSITYNSVIPSASEYRRGGSSNASQSNSSNYLGSNRNNNYNNAPHLTQVPQGYSKKYNYNYGNQNHQNYRNHGNTNRYNNTNDRNNHNQGNHYFEKYQNANNSTYYPTIAPYDITQNLVYSPTFVNEDLSNNNNSNRGPYLNNYSSNQDNTSLLPPPNNNFNKDEILPLNTPSLITNQLPLKSPQYAGKNLNLSLGRDTIFSDNSTSSSQILPCIDATEMVQHYASQQKGHKPHSSKSHSLIENYAHYGAQASNNSNNPNQYSRANRDYGSNIRHAFSRQQPCDISQPYTSHSTSSINPTNMGLLRDVKSDNYVAPKYEGMPNSSHHLSKYMVPQDNLSSPTTHSVIPSQIYSTYLPYNENSLNSTGYQVINPSSTIDISTNDYYALQSSIQLNKEIFDHIICQDQNQNSVVDQQSISDHIVKELGKYAGDASYATAPTIPDINPTPKALPLSIATIPADSSEKFLDQAPVSEPESRDTVAEVDASSHDVSGCLPVEEKPAVESAEEEEESSEEEDLPQGAKLSYAQVLARKNKKKKMAKPAMVAAEAATNQAPPANAATTPVGQISATPTNIDIAYPKHPPYDNGATKAGNHRGNNAWHEEERIIDHAAQPKESSNSATTTGGGGGFKRRPTPTNNSIPNANFSNNRGKNFITSAAVVATNNSRASPGPSRSPSNASLSSQQPAPATGFQRSTINSNHYNNDNRKRFIPNRPPAPASNHHPAGSENLAGSFHHQSKPQAHHNSRSSNNNSPSNARPSFAPNNHQRPYFANNHNLNNGRTSTGIVRPGTPHGRFPKDPVAAIVSTGNKNDNELPAAPSSKPFISTHSTARNTNCTLAQGNVTSNSSNSSPSRYGNGTFAQEQHRRPFTTTPPVNNNPNNRTPNFNRGGSRNAGPYANRNYPYQQTRSNASLPHHGTSGIRLGGVQTHPFPRPQVNGNGGAYKPSESPIKIAPQQKFVKGWGDKVKAVKSEQQPNNKPTIAITSETAISSCNNGPNVSSPSDDVSEKTVINSVQDSSLNGEVLEGKERWIEQSNRINRKKK